MQNSSRFDSTVQPEELTFIRQWAASLLDGSRRPFSFRVGERTSADVLAGAPETATSDDSTPQASQHTLTWRDASTGLTVLLDVTTYRDVPAVEWVLHFRNDGSQATPILSVVNAMDVFWKGLGPGTPILHRSRGSDERPDDFQYLSESMRNFRRPLTFSMNAGDSGTGMGCGRDGRSSVAWLPFFNLQTGADGLMLAIGWSGRWEATFANDTSDQVHATAGLQYMRLALQPGETIRMPRILVLYWRGQPLHGHNVLRQFQLRYHTPQAGEKPVEAPLCQGAWGGTPTDQHLEMLDTITEQQLPYDYYWIDAGWYGTDPEPCPDVFHGTWSIVGDWRVNRHRHPDGLRPISDAVHRAGMKFLLWIEPLRASNGTPVTEEHPDWFLTPDGQPPSQLHEGLLLNLGNPEARKWAVDTVSGLIEENGIDCYREDFNFFSSLEAFLAHDPPDRQGITEIRFIEGLYAFWDELRRRHPQLLIDNCASGGRRIDLETVSRSLPLWRTDYTCFPGRTQAEALQIHTCGLTRWVPLSATSPVATPGDTYQVRSAFSAGLVFSLNEIGMADTPLDDNFPWAWVRKMMTEYRRVRPFWYGDFYPLTSCSTAADTWMAFQLHRPDLDAGALLAFRRPDSPFKTATFPLHGLNDDTAYTVEDADSNEQWILRPTEAEDILDLTILHTRESRLLFYRAGVSKSE